MKKFEELVKETNEKLQIKRNQPQQEIIDENIIRFVQKASGWTQSRLSSSKKQFPGESSEHYTLRMMVNGYFAEAFSKYKTYKTGDYYYFVLTDADTTYKDLKANLDAKLNQKINDDKESGTTDDANPKQTLINFCRLDSTQNPDNQTAFCEMCKSNLYSLGRQSSYGTRPLGTSGRLPNSNVIDSVNNDKLLKKVSDLLGGTASSINPAEAAPSEAGEETPPSEQPNQSSSDESRYPELVKTDLQIDKQIWLNEDRQIHIENMDKMILANWSSFYNAATQVLKTTNPFNKSQPQQPQIIYGVNGKPISSAFGFKPIIQPASQTGDSSTSKDSVNTIIDELFRTYKSSLHGLFSNKTYLLTFFTRLKDDPNFLESIADDMKKNMTSLEQKENIYYQDFGAPAYPYDNSGKYSFYQKVLNQIPTSLEKEGYAQAGDNVFFVPKQLLDDAMRENRFWKLIRYKSGYLIKKAWDYAKNRFSSNPYNVQNIKTYGGS